MYDYEHTQRGTVLRVICGGVAGFLAVAGVVLLLMGESPGEVVYVGIPFVLMSVVLALFHSLTVRVSKNELQIVFGIGVISRTWQTADIEDFVAVKNHWILGWGIKRFRGGWLYNVSGQDAVEISLRNGTKFRIGTDEPRELLAALQTLTSQS